jgi:hypothetical protein
MANITTYLENALLNHVGGGTSLSQPTTYAALFTTTPTAAYTSTVPNGTELTNNVNGYVRKRIGWQSANSGIIKNTNTTYALTWTATGQWASGNSITTIGIFDAPTTGNLLWFGPLSAPVIMNSGDTFTIPTDSLTISIS